MQIQGNGALVTGGASGLGTATARRLAALGARVTIADMNEELGQQVAAEISQRAGAGANGMARFVRTDVTDAASCEAAVAAAAADGGLHILVNCAGIVVAERILGKGGRHDLARFSRVIQVNLIGTFTMLMLAGEAMAQNAPNDEGERGVIINTSSIAAFEGQIGQVAYTASKAAIAGMALTMARDVGSLGIRVTAIAPSLFDTGITKGIPEDFKEPLTRDAAFPKRMGRPDEYARLAVAIIENPMLNGGTIRLDAGQRFAPK